MPEDWPDYLRNTETELKWIPQYTAVCNLWNMVSLNLIIKSYVAIHQEDTNPDLCDVFHDKVNLIAIVIASQGCNLEVFL